MAERSRCDQCGASLDADVNYCPDCGAPQSVTIFDPLHATSSTAGSTWGEGAYPRNAVVVTLAVVAVVVLGVWLLGRGSERPGGDASADEVPGEIEPIDLAAPTTTRGVTSTSVPPTTRPASDTTEPAELSYVNESPGPVLGPDIDGYVVEIVSRSMRRLDLSTGAVIDVDLDSEVMILEPRRDPVVIDGRLVSVLADQLVLTDLTTGDQILQHLDIGNTDVVIGRAGPDSVWVSDFYDSGSRVVEVELEGTARRSVDLPQAFYPRTADGDEIWLDSIDGGWRYDTLTGEAARLPGQPLSGGSGPLVTVECTPELECHAMIDRGDGPTRLESTNLEQVWFWPIQISPDRERALLPEDGERGLQFTLLHLATGEAVDLGTLPIEPYFGIVWVNDSAWMTGRHNVDPARRWVAVHADTGEQRILEFDRGIAHPLDSVLVYIPA